MRKLIILSAICFFTSCALRNTNRPGFPLAGLETVPQLSHTQMLEDHDSLVSLIHQVSPVIYFNKEVRRIDFDRYARRLRKGITPKTTMADFLHIVDMTLNVAQDGHSGRLGSWQLNIMRTNWIPNGIIKHIDSISMVYGHAYEKFANRNFTNKLELNLVYTNGDYYNMLPFSYKGVKFPASMRLRSCNGLKVHAFVKKQFAHISPLRWDRANRKVYHEAFYKSAEFFKRGGIRLVFEDKQGNRMQLNASSGDTVSFAKKIMHQFGYNNESAPLTTHYFEKEGIFYAKMPLMEEAYGDSLAKQLKPFIERSIVKSIVLDIRGNGGGSDNTYANFLGRIMKDTLKQDVVVGRNFSPYNQKQFNVNADSVKSKKGFSFNVDVATFKQPKMYFISIPNFTFVLPDSLNYSFKGKVYVLQDRYIYSSASNLSNLAARNDQLVSIGETPNLLGGLQTNPSILQLPNSKIIFRIEPQIDFTGAKSVVDAFQNHVEYPVSYSIEELYQRVTSSDDIFGRKFLYEKDPMFLKVLELEGVQLRNKRRP